jgi:phosphate transport system substrate-binding protein
LLTIIIMLVTAVGCAESDIGGGTVQVEGSDTMVNLAGRWAEDYVSLYPDNDIVVTDGGSDTGIAAMIDGTADLANSSRRMTTGELEQAKAAGIEVEENLVGLDGIAVIVHPDNPVTELSMQQLSDIFTGAVTDWSQVGGNAGPIDILSRESKSGTYDLFREHVLGNQEYSPEARLMPTSQAIFEEVRQNSNGIGYVGMGYVQDGVKATGISDDGSAIIASTESVQSGAYPLSRPLYIYSRADASLSALDFVNWIQSEAGQAIVLELDFVPLEDSAAAPGATGY